MPRAINRTTIQRRWHTCSARLWTYSARLSLKPHQANQNAGCGLHSHDERAGIVEDSGDERPWVPRKPTRAHARGHGRCAGAETKERPPGWRAFWWCSGELTVAGCGGRQHPSFAHFTGGASTAPSWVGIRDAAIVQSRASAVDRASPLTSTDSVHPSRGAGRQRGSMYPAFAETRRESSN